MNKNIIRFISKSLSIVLAIALIITTSSINANADNNINSINTNIDPVIVVSLGDSYSSGEGIEPFYGQSKVMSERVKDEDWLAHRSQKSWPSQLEIPGIDGSMKDYKDIRGGTCEWYFVASSGAVTKDITNQQQKKVYNIENLMGTSYLPKQLDAFNDINGTVDYVTLSIGGNDVEFSEIIKKAATGSTYLGSKKLEKQLNSVWESIDVVTSNIMKTYEGIAASAGLQAEIIVAGYPKLLDQDGKGKFISKKEATLINESVSDFNEKISDVVNKCKEERGINISFVDVESEFNGHEAYSSTPWINKIIFGHEEQDIDHMVVSSSYSIHPNNLGAQAYARLVNEKIEEIEATKKEGTLSGKICKALDRVSPIGNANISIYKDNLLVKTESVNNYGNYSLKLPIGDYRIEISSPGYIDFTSYATVTENNNTYMETFLLVTGSESENGIATGMINNALTGMGVEGVSLSIRKGWNNTEYGDVVSTVITDSNGKYSVTLPLGNYTIIAEKPGYISGTVNIIVQSGTTDSQNGTITPTISGDNFRVILTWGEKPSDLDSHVVGTLSQGNFHVYYGSKSVYDGDVAVCNLDHDDTTSYGPETITLNTSTSNYPFYYYIKRYSGSGTVATSEAKIKVYNNENLVATFNVPTDQGSGDYWNVFAIVNGKLQIKNTITNNADVSYAIAPVRSLLNLDDEILNTETKDEKNISKEIPVEESVISETEIEE